MRLHLKPLIGIGVAVIVGLIYPTEGVCNESDSVLQLPAPRLDPPSGFYHAGVSVTIRSDNESAEIRYTLDGSVPRDSSPSYTAPLRLTHTSVVRAKAFSAGSPHSETASGSYILDHDTSLLVVSILTEPNRLWSDSAGIYVDGCNMDPNPPHYGANYWQDWEIPAHIDVLEPDGMTGSSFEAGIKIHGGWSRINRQKSLRITARDEYGSDRLEYAFFEDLPIISFKSLILRNSGQDWRHTMMRDALMTGLGGDLGIGIQAYRPAVVYLNGEYWGIHNIRERIDEHYLSSHYGVDKDELDLLDDSQPAEAGDRQAYRRLMDFVTLQDMSQDVLYDSVNTLMDVDNFITYVIAEVFFANGDWPAHNVRCWRPRRAEGRFQWLLFDTDHGFGWWYNTYDYNTLNDALGVDEEDISRLPDVTRLLASLLKNNSFKARFLVRFSDVMNIFFAKEIVSARIDSLAEVIHDEMPFHEARWYPDHDWDEEVQTLREFAQYRKGHVMGHLREMFDLEEAVLLIVDFNGIPGGRLRINGIPLPEVPWEGFYFQGLPIRLTAEPLEGYRFVTWEGDLETSMAEVSVCPEGDLSISAVFEPLETQAAGVVITEVNYHGPSTGDPGDWIELHSFRGDHEIGDWVIRDDRDDHVFLLGPSTTILEGEFLVVASDRGQFVELFPWVPVVPGELGFDLSNGGDQVRLYDNMGALVDSVAYDDEYPWPGLADGSGATLQLMHPAYANEFAHNWRASTRPLGDPGEGSYAVEPIKQVDLVPRSLVLHDVYPNPFQSSATALVGAANEGEVRLQLYTMQGRLVRTLTSECLTPGRHRLRFETAGLSNGIYLLNVSSLRSCDQSRIVIRLAD